jgi:protease-4
MEGNFMSQNVPDPGTSLQSEVISALLKDKKSERLWKNLRLFSVLGLVAAYTVGAILGVPSMKSEDSPVDSFGKPVPYTSVVRITGEISAGGDASAERLNPLLTKAFADQNAKGVVLVINSPGGTPVQAALIHDRIVQLKAEHKKKVVVVAEDMLTSGAYMIAVSADKIVVNRSTLTGSIGVITHGFGFTGLMEKVGIERRTMQAGASKNRMDPYGPLLEADKAKMSETLNAIHQHFIDIVKNGRKGKLKGTDEDLFAGDYWTGNQAVALGLADEVSDLPTLLQKDFGVKKMREYSNPRPIWERLTRTVTSQVLSAVTTQTASQIQMLPR